MSSLVLFDLINEIRDLLHTDVFEGEVLLGFGCHFMFKIVHSHLVINIFECQNNGEDRVLIHIVPSVSVHE